MIRPQELRIGNWFKYGDEIVIVSTIFKSHFNCEKLNGVTIGNNMQNHFTPIPLTPEILDRTNSVPDNYGVFYLRKDGIKKSESGMKIQFLFKMCEIDGENVLDFCVGNSIANAVHLKYIKYLHQLQNLYFALTGEELVYTP